MAAIHRNGEGVKPDEYAKLVVVSADGNVNYLKHRICNGEGTLNKYDAFFDFH